MTNKSSNLATHLAALYGDSVGRATWARLSPILDTYRAQFAAPPAPHLSTAKLTERDVVLITYGDQVQAAGRAPLGVLADFSAQQLTGLINTIHLLPFYPYSSDDGFSVMDYRQVDPALGRWDDMARLGQHFRLMFDAVVNHVSVQSEWFQRFLRDDPRYRDYFIVVPQDADLAQVVRPRTSPVLTLFQTPSGAKQVWTTFSADQVDLNYRNPDVLIEVIDTLLFYVAQGAQWLRLDAIAFLWKELGTSCLHLPQTHRVIQALRTALDDVAPQVRLITETNVPHADNVAYFGDGTNEAQLVYNFALPPLVWHTLQTSDARTLSRWASELVLPSPQATFFNFLASHDGIGLNPVRGLLSAPAIEALVANTLAHGGFVSYKHNPDGTVSPYELNINYFDALSAPNSGESLETQVDRFSVAQAIMLAIVGVPGIYFHSLFGSSSWRAGVALTGQNRAINRAKCDRLELEHALADPTSQRCHVFTRYTQLLRARTTHPAFDPQGAMRVFDAGPALFAIGRSTPQGQILCLHNVANANQIVELDLAQTLGSNRAEDLLTGQVYDCSRTLTLSPYQVLWLVRATGAV